MQPERPFSDTTIHLRCDSGGSPPPTSAITVPFSAGVDLGLVGRSLGLDPNTVRLNGYYVSRSGPCHVSPGLSWGPLLDFFAQRGFPCGGGAGDAILVQGKHVGSTDGNPFIKRKFQLETEIPLKKRKLETNYKPNENVTLSTKRSLNSDDVLVPFKKMKMAYANTGTCKSHTATTFSHLTIYLRLCSSVSSSGASPPNFCSITVTLSSAVDIGLVGRVLGLDPKTVRLNGYYVSRSGPHYMSPGLSWGPLLDFFAQRGLPCGREVQDAVLVQGKHVGPTDRSIFLKRKVGLVAECPKQKRKSTNYESNESVIHRAKRIINYDGIQDSFKKMKLAYSNTGTRKSQNGMHVSQVSRFDGHCK